MQFRQHAGWRDVRNRGLLVLPAGHNVTLAFPHRIEAHLSDRSRIIVLLLCTLVSIMSAPLFNARRCNADA
jgi:hypothetical protein